MAGQSNSGRFTEWLVNQIGENLKLHFCQLVLIDLAFTNVIMKVTIKCSSQQFSHGTLYIQYSTGTYCTVPVHTIQYRYILYSAGTYSTVPVHTVQYRYILYSTVTYCTVPVHTVQSRYILYSTGTYSTVQCTVPVHMYCTVPVHTAHCTVHSTGAYVICIFGITNVDDNSVTIVNGKYRHKTELIIVS